jgi:tRNA(fMet)-specific endonuclease VapC
MYLLDTDHVTIVQQQTTPEYRRLIERVREHEPEEFYVSIVSFHEQMMGWNAFISKAKDLPGVVRGYTQLFKVLSNFAEAQLVLFDDSAADVFKNLKAQRVRIGTMDLRIAAIALSRNLTVLSRNVSDFRKVPGLEIEDWTGV